MIKYEAFDGDECNVIGAFKLKGDLVDVHWSLQGVVVRGGQKTVKPDPPDQSGRPVRPSGRP
jgi:hypothetical protein